MPVSASVSTLTIVYALIVLVVALTGLSFFLAHRLSQEKARVEQCRVRLAEEERAHMNTKVELEAQHRLAAGPNEQFRAKLADEERAHMRTTAQAEYQRGFTEGAESVRSSIRYEYEAFALQETGFFKKDVSVRIRERVMLGNLQISQSENTVLLSSEINEENFWHLLQQATDLALGPGVDVVRRIAPGVLEAALSARKKFRLQKYS